MRAELEARQIGYVLAMAVIGACPPQPAQACRHAGQCPEEGPATTVRRPGSERTALLRLGPDHTARPGWTPLAADPPPPAPWTTGLLLLPLPGPGPARRAGPSRCAGGPPRTASQAGKGLAGLDDYQLSRWPPWRRWTLLAILRHAALAAIAATQRAQHLPQLGLIALACRKIQHLFTKLIVESTRRHADTLA